MEYLFGSEKNEQLKNERGFSFEDIIVALQQDGLIHSEKHPNAGKYENQHVLYVKMTDGIYVVPCILGEDEIFLKTAFRSRVATKKFNS
ncbi:MAG: toxin [Candidatus Gracilibacteria bacterium]|nr:toxin [Candidatus Gracilibacteria bacterium]